MCASIGMNVARDGTSSPDLIRSLGATWLRIVAMPDVDLTTYFQRCRTLGIQIMLVLARESGGDYAAYQRTYGSLIDCVQVGNEPDLDSPSSWGMTAVELASLGRQARQIFGTMPIVTAGLASGHPEWPNGIDLSWADAIAFHPYLKDATPGNDLPDVGELLDGYRVFGKPVIISEWGWWGTDEQRGADEVRDMVRWAASTDQIEVFFYFCLSDSMVPPFGLYRTDGSAKPAADYVMGAAAGAIQSFWPWTPQPEPEPDPETPMTDPWQWFSAEQIADALPANLGHVRLYWPKLAAQLDLAGIYDRLTAIAVLGTIAVEVGARFEPIHEYGTPADWAGYSGGSAYAGRGFIQLTHDYNYRAYSTAINDLWGAGGAIDLVARPDDALDPDVAAAVMALYFRDHGIPAMAADGNWAGIRRAVNGGMTGWQTFADAVEALKAISPPSPPPTSDPRDQTIADLTLALRTLRDETLPAAATQVAEAQRIVEQFIGSRL